MKAGELKALLGEFHPDDDVVIFTDSRRVMQILGFNAQASMSLGCVALRGDWSVNGDTVEESEVEKLIRERDRMDAQIERIEKAERKKARPTKKKIGRPRKKQCPP